MWKRFVLVVAVTWVAVRIAGAQQSGPGNAVQASPSTFSSPGAADSASGGPRASMVSPSPTTPAAMGNPGHANEAAPRRPVTRVSTGTGSLPNESGQLYREYDISPYTSRITTTKRPEQAVVDWILRETGYEAWHGEPLAILSATPKTLRVYHTPQIQAMVAEIVDRFNSTEAEGQSFGIRVITLDSPDWRVRVQRLLNPYPIRAPGCQAWVLEKEAAAAVLNELRRRSDYREHSSPQLLVPNGQPAVVSAMRGRNYVRDVKLRPDAWPGFEPESAVVDEGFSLEFTPLLLLDGKTIEAAIRCDVDQVERLVPVTLNIPTPVAPRQTTRIDVPQMAHFRFQERFRWSQDRILIVDLGVVPSPMPRDGRSLVPGLPLPISGGPPRSDLLLVVESRGKVGPTAPQVTRGVAPVAEGLRAR
jgi:hypothetical protein